MSSLWYTICLYLARFVYWTLGGLKGVNEHNVPRSGPLIVAPNHVSLLDPPAVACGTNRHLRFMAKEELFRAKGFGWLIRSLGAFPVSRGEGDTEAIRTAINAINSGDAVLIFPEGTRGNGKVIQPVNRGVTMLAKRTGAKVMPVAIVGTHLVWPKGQKKIKRGKIRIVYGVPFTYEEVAKGSNERENRETFALELQKRIAQLCNDNGMPVKIEPNTERSRTSPAGSP
jgi:1-acyl-sn-glycerol-3-phosphate acyltransferase